MPWEPEQFEDAKNKILTRAFETAVSAWHRQKKQFQQESAAQGRFGGMVLGNAERTAADAILDASTRSLEELSSLLTGVYGVVPPEAAEWIQLSIEERADGMAAGLSHQLASAREQNKVKTDGADEHVKRALAEAKRDLDIALQPLRIRSQLQQLTPPVRTNPAEAGADVFICHASEDKEAVALPLSKRLIEHGYSVWLDKFSLKLGDRLLEKIDDGITTCRFGVVVLSPHFFAKQWPKRELSGLAAREDAEERRLILPIRVDITQGELARQSALLAAILGADWTQGIDVVVNQIVEVLGPPNVVVRQE